MSRITSSVGLITGVPIEETVKKLMAIAARPRDILQSRTQDLQKQQSALDALGSRLLAFKFAVNKFNAASVFESRTVASSDPDALEAAAPASGATTPGTFLVRPVRTASAQTLLSQPIEDAEAELGTGSFSFRVGGFLDEGLDLGALNGGTGVQRGKIKITDRSGTTATIDLSFARTVEDVLDAINNNEDISVTAATDGDSFTLADSSGGTGNLRVQEVGGGVTAASLGLGGINVAADAATGADVVRIAAETKLADLNDGNGVALTAEGVDDLTVTLRDGSTLDIDLADAKTVGDLLAQINAAGGSRLSAAVAADGSRLQLTDLTAGAGALTVADAASGSVATQLGLAGTTSGATLAGERLVAGLRDTLLRSLNGGAGAALGSIQITDRSGTSATVDLAAAETVGQAIEAINAAAVGVEAGLSASRGGIVVRDTTGGAGNLRIANNDAVDSVEALGIGVDAAVESVASGALNRQVLGAATLLSSLSGGQGVTLGDLRITNSRGVVKAVDLNTVGSEPVTVGDVINAINASGAQVEARINDAGDGVAIIDRAGGALPVAVKDISGTIASSLRLDRASQTRTIDGVERQVIDGTSSFAVDLEDLDVSGNAIPLASLNGGAGVALGDVLITDSRGRSIGLDLNGADSGITTVGQLIDLINQKAAAAPGGSGISASLNTAGTGIRIEDSSRGTGVLTVQDINSTTAKDLKILSAAQADDDGQFINGGNAFAAVAANESGLKALAAKINSLDAGVTASTVFDGVAYRLSLASTATGEGNELLIDATDAGLEFEEASQGRDALLLYGNFNTPGGGILLASPTNSFAGAVGGVDVTINAASDDPVEVTVAQTDAKVIEAFEDLVESYNSLRGDLAKLTSFDAETATTGLLFGTNEALQIDQRLSRAVTDRYLGLGQFETLAEIGLQVTADGELELDSAKLSEAFAEGGADLRSLLTDSGRGVVAQLVGVVDRLAGEEDSLLAARSDAIQDTIEANTIRLERFSIQLEKQQERLSLQFYQLEQIVARLQTNLTAIQSLSVIKPVTS